MNFPWIKLDHWYEMVIVGVFLLAALYTAIRGIGGIVRMIIEFAKKGGKFKFRFKDGGAEISESATIEPCAPYVVEHTEILKKLEQSVKLLTDIQATTSREIAGIDNMQRAQNESLDVLLGLAAGEEPNGQIERARIGLAKAQGFKDATSATQGGPG